MPTLSQLNLDNVIEGTTAGINDTDPGPCWSGKSETVAHATVDAAGAYEFRDIAVGEYTLVFVSQHRTMLDKRSPSPGTPLGYVHTQVVYIEPRKTIASSCRFGLTPDD